MTNGGASVTKGWGTSSTRVLQWCFCISLLDLPHYGMTYIISASKGKTSTNGFSTCSTSCSPGGTFHLLSTWQWLQGPSLSCHTNTILSALGTECWWAPQWAHGTAQKPCFTHTALNQLYYLLCVNGLKFYSKTTIHKTRKKYLWGKGITKFWCKLKW